MRKKDMGVVTHGFNLQFFWHGPLRFFCHLIVIVPIPTHGKQLEYMRNQEDQKMKHT